MSEPIMYELEIVEATSDMAKEIIAFSKKVGSQTSHLTFGEEGMDLPVETMATRLDWIRASVNQLVLVAIIDGEIVGLGSISGLHQEKVLHVGQLGISVSEDFWGLGIGTALVEELLYWATEHPVLRRIELDVRVDNECAIRLYKDQGFVIEGCLRGALKDHDQLFDVYRMGYYFFDIEG